MVEQTIIQILKGLPAAQQRQETELIERYRSGEISSGKLAELLGLSSRWKVEAFLRDKGIELNYDEKEFAQDLDTVSRLEDLGKLTSA